MDRFLKAIALSEILSIRLYLDQLGRKWEHYGSTFMPGKGYKRDIWGRLRYLRS